MSLKDLLEKTEAKLVQDIARLEGNLAGLPEASADVCHQELRRLYSVGIEVRREALTRVRSVGRDPRADL